MDWTDEVIERLRAFWAEGHSTAEIGRRMGVSKNAVVGKAHRLGLAARPSPIRRAEGSEVPRRASIRRAVGPTLPPFEAEQPAPVKVAPPVHVMPVPAMAAPAAVRVPMASINPSPVLAASSVVPARAPSSNPVSSLRSIGRASGGRIIPCCWPTGEPGTRSFRFCDAASAAGKPYCSQHAALAYVKIRDRREDAA